MKARIQRWWDVLPFSAKAAMIVLVAGLTITVSARAATPLVEDGPASSGPTATHTSTFAKSEHLPLPTALGVTLTAFKPTASRPRRRPELVTTRGARPAFTLHRARRAAHRDHATDATELERSARFGAESTVDAVSRSVPLGLPLTPVGLIRRLVP